MNILDSSLVIDFLKTGKVSQSVIKQLGDEKIAISSFTVHEVLVGTNEKEIFILTNLLEGIDVYTYGYETAIISSKIEKSLRKQGTIIGITDVYIAAIAMQHDATLVTLDKDFEKVEGLKVQVF